MNNLKTIRKRSKKAQKDIAAALGVSRATLWNYETGHRKLAFDIAVKLAKIYGCSVADFVDEVDGSVGTQGTGSGTN